MNRSQRLRLVGIESELVFRMRAACNTTMAGAGTQSMSSRHAASNTANSSSSLLMPSLSLRYRQVSHLPDLALRAPPPATVVPRSLGWLGTDVPRWISLGGDVRLVVLGGNALSRLQGVLAALAGPGFP